MLSQHAHCLSSALPAGLLWSRVACRGCTLPALTSPMDALLSRSTFAYTAAMACWRIMYPVRIPTLSAHMPHEPRQSVF